MPRKVGAGTGPNMPLPVGGAQDDRLPPASPQGSASSSSAPSASRPATAKDKAQGKNLREQLAEANRQKSVEWKQRSRQTTIVVDRLMNRLEIANNIASSAAKAYIDIKALHRLAPENEEQALKKSRIWNGTSRNSARR